MRSVPSREALVGGRYEVESQVGEGGMGSIWRARHVTLGSHVAIKFLHPSAVTRPGARERFLCEAQLMAQLQTRRAVQVFDFGITSDDVPFLVMELVDGETLADKIAREGKLAGGTTARILGEAARGLEKAHAAGIVHRDLKPENILLTLDEDGAVAVKVADFGVAKLCAASDRTGPHRMSKGSGVSGTPLYMAPEQLRGDLEIDASADIWAFGVCAYECVTGKLPFRAQDLTVLLSRMDLRVYAPPTTLVSWLPYAFDAWFERACARAPEDRFSNVREAAAELAAALGAEPMARPSGSISISDAPVSTRIVIASRASEPSVPPLRSPTHDAPIASSRRWLAPLFAAALVSTIALLGAALFLRSRPFASAPAQPLLLPALTAVDPICAQPADAHSADPEPLVSASAPRTMTFAAPISKPFPPSYRGLPDELPAPKNATRASFKDDPY